MEGAAAFSVFQEKSAVSYSKRLQELEVETRSSDKHMGDCEEEEDDDETRHKQARPSRTPVEQGRPATDRLRRAPQYTPKVRPAGGRDRDVDSDGSDIEGRSLHEMDPTSALKDEHATRSDACGFEGAAWVPPPPLDDSTGVFAVAHLPDSQDMKEVHKEIN